jgi:hypothetical protein
MEKVRGAFSKTSRELPKVVLFGDSLTAWSFDTVHGKGLGDVLTRHYEGPADVVNEGMHFLVMSASQSNNRSCRFRIVPC